MAKKHQQKGNESELSVGLVFIIIGMVLTLTIDTMRLVGLPFIVIGVVFVSQASGWI
jgi:hypothetical protein